MARVERNYRGKQRESAAQERHANRYTQLIERVFLAHYREGATEVCFQRAELETTASQLGVRLPKNLGDLIYSFRYRTPLPKSIREKAPPGTQWIIRPAGRSQYCFVSSSVASFSPNPLMAQIKVPDATPGVIAMYALTDEQSLLAKVRYNRLIDIFTGVTCYSLQNHLRTTVPQMGQVETDELYVGIDKRGAHYIIPVQAKGGRDRINVVQIEQDVAMCVAKFPTLICLPVAAQFTDQDLIVLFAFETSDDGLKITGEKHYRLVPPEKMSAEDLRKYRQQALAGS